MPSDFLSVNKTRKPLQVEIRESEDQEGREGAMKEWGSRYLKKTYGMSEREAIVKPNTVGVWEKMESN